MPHNNRYDMPVRFTVTMLCEPGKAMLTFVGEGELAQRKNRRTAQEPPGPRAH